MNSDFVFVNPDKIPPRRSVKISRYGRLKIKKVNDKFWEKDYENEADDYDETPEFSLLEGVLPQTHLAGENADPLTQAIFGLESPSRSRAVQPYLTRSFKTKSELPVGLPEKPKPKTISREVLLAELENIDSQDQELFQKINALEAPSRSVPIHWASSMPAEPVSPGPELKINVVSKKSFYTDFEEEKNLASASSGSVPLEGEADYHRAESDWFQVGLAAPVRILELKKYAEDRIVSPDNILKANLPQEKTSGRFITYLAFFLLMLVPVSAGVFLYSGKDNFIKAAFGNFNTRLLSASSFTLVNAEEGSVFPPLIELRSEIKNLGLSSEAVSGITGFLEKNAEFSWLDVFKRKSASGHFTLLDVETLVKAQNILIGLAAKDEKTNLLVEKFSSYVAGLGFWNRLLTPGQNYLVVVMDENAAWPGGGQPKSYVVVKTGEAGLEPTAYGKFSSLDAAVALKLAPPEPIKTVSTAWLPSQSFWFLNFKDSAKTLASFFENTAGAKIDGVIAVNEKFLKDFSFKENLIFKTDSDNWFYGLIDAIGRKPVGRFGSLAQSLNQGLAEHRVQFYFEDSALENFAEKSGWQIVAQPDFTPGDFLGLGWVGLKGGVASLDLVEYRGQIFEDGSVMVGLNITIRQARGSDSQSYFKIYLPTGTQLLKAEGFSSREKIPEFDYAAQGFTVDSRLKSLAASSLENVDFYEEGESSVAGGWVNLKSGSRGALSLEYLLPVKISEKNGSGVYNLKVIRPAQTENTPFRFVAVPQKGVEIVSLEPNGFVTENLGEYQGSLAQDLRLEAVLRFND